MAGRGSGLGKLIVVLVLGLFIGGAVGEALALILPNGVVKTFFVKPVPYSLGPGTLDLHAFAVTMGLSINVNVMSVLGVVLAIYLLRWFRW
jgi:pimeloyl-ACP methyl ester carboxylesterase